MNDYEKALIEFLLPMVNESRLKMLDSVLVNRTRWLTVILEDIYQPHNASAVLRTCDCYGIQDVHIIENQNSYKINPQVELGAAQWLTLHKYNKADSNTYDAISKIKEMGYSVIATSPHKNDVNLDDFDVTASRTAIILGTEKQGLSDVAMEMADGFIRIPMLGFTESFNISVSAAIILHQLSNDLRKSSVNWHLSTDEMEKIRFQWLKNSVNKIQAIEKGFKKQFYR